jgi:hypothetical protein
MFFVGFTKFVVRRYFLLRHECIKGWSSTGVTHRQMEITYVLRDIMGSV